MNQFCKIILLIVIFGFNLLFKIDLLAQNRLIEANETEKLDEWSLESTTNNFENFFENIKQNNQNDEDNYSTKIFSWRIWIERLLKISSPKDETTYLSQHSNDLLTLEFLFKTPLEYDQLNKYSYLFFWLSEKEQIDLADFTEATIEGKMTENQLDKFLNQSRYELILPLIKFKKSVKTSTPSDESLKLGIAWKTSKLKSQDDFPLLLKNYHLRNYAHYQWDNHLELFYLADRDPNEYKTIDLIKWGVVVTHLPVEILVGATKLQLSQRLLFSTGYQSSKSISSPFTPKKMSSQPTVLSIDKGGNEIYLKSVSLKYQNDNWQSIILFGQYLYDRELDSFITNDSYGDPIDSQTYYTETVSLSSQYHELPITNRLQEKLFLFHFEAMFDGSYFNRSKLSTSFIYSELNAPVFTDNENNFYGKKYFGQSVSWSLFPKIDNHPIKAVSTTHLEWFGELAWLANENQQVSSNPETEDANLKIPYSDSNRNFSYHLAFSGGLLIYLNTGNLLLHYRQIPTGYQSIHNLSFQESRHEKGLYLAYRHLIGSKFNWNFNSDFYQNLEDESTAMEIQNYFKYRFSKLYSLKQETRLKETETAFNYYLDFDNEWRLYFYKKILRLSANINSVGSSDSDYLPSWFAELKLNFQSNGPDFKYRTTLQFGWSVYQGTEIYTSFYHNPYFRDNLYLAQNTAIALTRHEFIWDNFKAGIGIGMRLESKNANSYFFQDPVGLGFFSGQLELMY